MHQSRVHWLGASAAALTLGAWAAACTSAEQQPQQNNPSIAVGPTTESSSVGTGGAATSTTITGSTATPTTTSATATGPSTATTTTGTSVTSATTDTSSATGGPTTTGTAATTVSGTTGIVGTTGVATTGSTPEPSCSTRPALTVPSLVDFESYDGATEAIDWGFEFNDDGSGENVLYGGFFDASDMSGTPTLNMVGGDTSTWAVRATNTQASDWGGGIGLWLGCMNASSYTGISLAVRGATPNQNAVSVALTVDGLTAGVGTTIYVTDLFQTFELPFSEFTNDYDETTNGDNINGLAINAQMLWVQDEATEEWSVTPGSYELVVDDITFY